MSTSRVAASIYWCKPGDEFNTGHGVPMHKEPRLIVPGHQPAAAFFVAGQPLAVLVFRRGENKLRYCDREGALQEESVSGDGMNAMMMTAMNRVGELLAAFLGDGVKVADIRPAERVALH